MILILFGLSGSGKNYIGELFQKYFDYYFWDADESLSEEIRAVLAQELPLTQSMRDKITKTLIARVKALNQEYPNLVIAQALYKEKNRLQLASQLPEAKLIYVETTVPIALKRIQHRKNSLVTPDQALQMAKEFEEPELRHYSILNTDIDEQSLLKQLNKIDKKVKST